MKFSAWDFWNRLMVVVGTIATVGAFIIAVFSLVSPGTITTALDNIAVRMGELKKETSDDARKELTNLGIPFDQSALWQAAMQDEDRAVNLLLKAGLKWSRSGDDSSYPVLKKLNDIKNESPHHFDAIIAQEGELDYLICKVLLHEAVDRPMWFSLMYPYATQAIVRARELGKPIIQCIDQNEIISMHRQYWQNFTPEFWHSDQMEADDEFMAKFEAFVASLS